MRINKRAPWGHRPAADAPLQPAAHSLRALVSEGHLHHGLAALRDTLDEGFPAVADQLQGVARELSGQTAVLVEVRDALTHLKPDDSLEPPGDFAFRLLARLVPVQAILCDLQHDKPAATNEHLRKELNAKATQDLLRRLKREHPSLVEDFEAQFAPLGNGSRPMDPERRERLVQLMALEWQLAALPGDDPAAQAQP